MERPNEALVTAQTFPSLSAAEVAKSMLAAAGIESHVQSADTLRLDPLQLSKPVAIRLQVLADDLEAARALLEPDPGFSSEEDTAGDDER